MADKKADNKATKTEEKNVTPDGGKMPKPLNEPTEPKKGETPKAAEGRMDHTHDLSNYGPGIDHAPRPAQPAAPALKDFAEEIPDGHEARVIVLSNTQWQALDRQTQRHNLTSSEYLRRFLAPYLR